VRRRLAGFDEDLTEPKRCHGDVWAQPIALGARQMLDERVPRLGQDHRVGGASRCPRHVTCHGAAARLDVVQGGCHGAARPPVDRNDTYDALNWHRTAADAPRHFIEPISSGAVVRRRPP
jgi:hypothetical protein